VYWLASADEGTIEAIEPRRNLFYRQDEVRTKSFAANLDQILLLIAAEPEFSERQLARALIAARAQGIAAVIALNKSDLGAPFSRAWEQLSGYREMGHLVMPLALKPRAQLGESSMDRLREVLRGKTTLLLGPSGAGKSTLINRLVPEAKVLTNAISKALGSGKHTTTSTTLYWVGEDHTTAVIDSPGFQEFGLAHIDPMHLAGLMPDIGSCAARCRFYNCTHLHEPGCAVLLAMAQQPQLEGPSPARFKIYSELFAELSAKHY
jgi:ribosome biogenesis GTPase